jgi:hypothetical protein
MAVEATSNPVLEQVRRAHHALANDPPNGVTTMAAITALDSAGKEIERLEGELKLALGGEVCATCFEEGIANGRFVRRVRPAKA